MSKSNRIKGVDTARGLASLIMIQGHAYHGWVAPEHHDGAYAFTRVLGTLPLPAFMVMAGAAVTLRLFVALQRGDDLLPVRRSVAKRGAQVMLWGYASNVAYAWMDGSQGWATYLRVDVLQCIGLCIMVAAGFIGPALSRTQALVRFGQLTLGLSLVVCLLCPWVSSWAALTAGPIRFLVALFGDVPGVTQMPFFPLFAWFGAGSLATLWLLSQRDGSELSRIVGSAGHAVFKLGLLGLLMATTGHYATEAMVHDLGFPLARSSWAILPNIIDGMGRGLLVLAVGAMLAYVLPPKSGRVMTTLGRGSLYAYVSHIPFCYGVLGAGLRGKLDMTSASLWLVPLVVGSVLVVYMRNAIARALASQRRDS